MNQYFVAYDYRYLDGEKRVQTARDAKLIQADSYPEAYQKAIEAFKRSTGQPLENILSFNVSLL